MPGRTRRPASPVADPQQRLDPAPQLDLTRQTMLRRQSTIQCHQPQRDLPTLGAFDPGLLRSLMGTQPAAGDRPARPRIDAPIPSSTAPRPSLQGMVQPEGWFDGPPLRQVDGDHDQQWTPTGRGPGTSHRGGDYTLDRLVQEGNYPTLIPDTHRELMHTELPDAARESLRGLHQQAHDPYNLGVGEYNVDEYSMIMDRLPPGFDTPGAFLEGFLQDPNGFANDRSATWNPLTTEGLLNDFDFYNQFTLERAGSQEDAGPDHVPVVGDWYHIDIPGNDGDVIIVDKVESDGRVQATVQTMTDQEFGPANDDHPVSGRRQFGIEQLPDGTYRFYTRGFDRQTTSAMDFQAGNAAQHADWSSLMRAMSEEHGGRPERTDASGRPKWGWCRQIPIRGLLGSMEE